MAFKTPNITSQYIRKLLPEEKDGDICRLLKYADENFIPVLLPETAAFLRQLLILKQPQKVLEIGTAIGYSGLLILKNSSAKLFTVEVEEQNVQIAKKFFVEAGCGKRATVFCGDAVEIVPLMEGEYDFIFLDGPKTRYTGFYPFLKRMLKSGGILVADNVLFNGMVDGSGEYKPKKASIARALDEYLKTVMSDEDMLSSILPVGDGLALSIKK